TAEIFVTCPTLTPLNSTGEPTDSPVIEPEKNITNVSRFWKNLPDPKIVMPAAASATAPTTNVPISVFLAWLAMAPPLAAGQEVDHPGVLRFRQQLPRVARGDHRLAPAVRKPRVFGDGEEAGGPGPPAPAGGAGAGGEIGVPPARPPRADRVEPRRGLVEEEDVGVERHRARQAGALLHAAADLRGIV